MRKIMENEIGCGETNISLDRFCVREGAIAATYSYKKHLYEMYWKEMNLVDNFFIYLFLCNTS